MVWPTLGSRTAKEQEQNMNVFGARVCDTIRYEMPFYRALESQHESAQSTARNRQLKSVETEKLKVENRHAHMHCVVQSATRWTR